MMRNILNFQRSSTIMPFYANPTQRNMNRSLFNHGAAEAQATRTGNSLNADHHDTLAAVFERSSAPHAAFANEKQIYKHPLSGSSLNRNPIMQAAKSYAEWNKQLVEQSKEYVKNFSDELKTRKTVVTKDDQEQLQKQLTSWLGDQRTDLTKRLKDAPLGISKKLFDSADTILGRLNDQIWSDMDTEIENHNNAINGKPQDPWSALKNLRRDVIGWNKSLKEDSKEFVDSFKEHLDSLPGKFSDKDLQDMREELDTWLKDRRDNLSDRLENVPDFISKGIMEMADRRLERFDNKMWDEITKAVKRHNDSIPPIDPENPLERANHIYDEWNKSLNDATTDYLNNFNKTLDEWAGVFTDENKQQLEQQLSQWLTDQRDSLEKSMNELPHGIVKDQLIKAQQYLTTLQEDMQSKIGQSIGQHNIAVGLVQQQFNDWNDSLADLSKDYFDSFKQNLSGLSTAVTDQQKEQMHQGLLGWLEDQRDDLQELLTGAPSGFSKLLKELGNHNVGQLGEQMWKSIQEEIEKHNRSIPQHPPVPQPGGSIPPGPVFTPGTTTRIEIGTGERKAILKLEDTNSQNRGKNLFYVVDALGHRKGVSITFNNELLQKEFEKRFKESSMYGKSISLYKFNEIISKLKKSLGEINDTDLERIKDKLNDKKATFDFDTLVSDFIGLLKKIKI